VPRAALAFLLEAAHEHRSLQSCAPSPAAAPVFLAIAQLQGVRALAAACWRPCALRRQAAHCCCFLSVPRTATKRVLIVGPARSCCFSLHGKSLGVGQGFRRSRSWIEQVWILRKADFICMLPSSSWHPHTSYAVCVNTLHHLQSSCPSSAGLGCLKSVGKESSGTKRSAAGAWRLRSRSGTCGNPCRPIQWSSSVRMLALGMSVWRDFCLFCCASRAALLLRRRCNNWGHTSRAHKDGAVRGPGA